MRYLSFCLFLVLVLSSCTSAYRDHFWAEHTSEPKELSFASVSGESVSILPDKRVKAQLIDSIQSARSRIWIEIYLWTDKDLLDAVIAAHQRGVDVRVALEGNVYSLPYANRTIFDALQRAGIPVVYTDNYQYTFTHAKFWIVDDQYAISTGNWTRSFFEANRDMIVHGRDPVILRFLTEVFMSDSAHESFGGSVPPTVVLSPTNSRSRLMAFLRSATSQIDVVAQTVSDPEILLLLLDRERAGVRVRICSASNAESEELASGSHLEWHIVKRPYLHIKTIFVDGSRLWIGSQNLTTNALENNREVGLLFADSGAFFSGVFSPIKKDCQFE